MAEHDRQNHPIRPAQHIHGNTSRRRKPVGQCGRGYRRDHPDEAGWAGRLFAQLYTLLDSDDDIMDIPGTYSRTRPTDGTNQDDTSQAEFWSSLGRILRQNNRFRWFLVARSISQLVMMGAAFYSVFAVQQHGASEAEVGLMTGTLLGTAIIANVIMGWISDRWSRKRVMEIGWRQAFWGHCWPGGRPAPAGLPCVCSHCSG